ncbi:DEAD/DEAH box helicase family protein [Sphingomonas sp. 2R-10]|uniref:DEAD/DEAH box helicase family protein n=1 Tax=Sphingomonas sp. 2R-10 TaxID=3045148 RepID=UPI0013DDDB6B|nr:DEAD/DEAH box helicase family protein [Sphingomonas sp. 2R-10]MDJ0275402.1 DEAD/DEAH box helicase family protein [Sphingomonas sp. 2R-10]
MTSASTSGPASGRGLQHLSDIRPLLILPDDDLPGEVLIPAFRSSTGALCMMGFFSSASLAELAPGLATFLNETDGVLRLIASPFISAADQAAIEAGTAEAAAVADAALSKVVVTEDALARHTLDCLAHLLKVGRLQMRVAVMRDGLFHPKVWVFTDGADQLAVHGSGNMTAAGMTSNYEQISVSKDWADTTQHFVVDKLQRRFDRLWKNVDDHCVVLGASEAVRAGIMAALRPGEPREPDFGALFDRAKAAAVEVVSRQPRGFAIPAGLRYEDGPFAHQGAAVRAWVDAGHRGILEMATGSGKTITSMIAGQRLVEAVGPTLIVVAAPYRPLVDQWCDEIEPFGITPVNLTLLSGAAARASALSKTARRLKHGLSKAEAVVVSHDTLCTPEFADATRKLGVRLLLIADEAHNLGREGFINEPPEHFEHRLALSATPVRQYDDVGTAGLVRFFGDVVYKFTLEQAIGKCLVEYDYHLVPTYLDEEEMDRWYDLTARIKQNAWRTDGGKPDDYLAKLFRDRRELLETSGGKIVALDRALGGLDTRALRHTLVYATDKSPRQLEEVNALLRRRGIAFHQLTATETGDRAKTRAVIAAFQAGDIQVLTAKRVLDEGVNIPQIRRAFVLASTTVERQWVQRRGRLLRTCSLIGKTSSDITDFLALPPGMDAGGLDDDAKSLVRSELKRVQEFGGLARNAGSNDGPLALTAKLVSAAFG